jgi:hypothetical protein
MTTFFNRTTLTARSPAIRSVVSLWLVGALAVSTAPVAAREGIAAAADHVGQSGVPKTIGWTPPHAATARTRSRRSSDWAEVIRLASGEKVAITIRGGEPGPRYVLSADQSVITTLNAADVTLPSAVRAALRETVSMHPDYFTNLQKGGTLLLDGNVLISRDGLFQSGQRLADFGRVVVQNQRSEVILATRLARTHPGRLGALIGAGAGVGLGIAGLGSLSCQQECGILAVILLIDGALGAAVGGAAGVLLGASSNRQEVIYKAP